MLPVGLIKSAPSNLASDHQNRYFMRSMHIDVLVDAESVTVFSKLGRLVLLGFVTRPGPQWKTWRIHIHKGHLGIQTFKTPHRFARYLVESADKYGLAHSNMSPRQQALVQSAAPTAGQEKWEGYVAFQADMQMSVANDPLLPITSSASFLATNYRTRCFSSAAGRMLYAKIPA
jgi:hypothetical protein